VEKTGVLGLGFIPNRHERRKQTKDQVAIRSSAGEAQEGSVRHRLTGAVSIIGAWVGARTGVLKKKREAKEVPSAWKGPRPRMAALASSVDEDCRSTGQAARGEKNEETVARAEKEEGTG
jgi:hypothetical protein